MTVLTDSVQLDVPARSPVEPAAPVDPPIEAVSRPSRAERSFELESPNGYLRTVVGTVEYLDEGADTYMVRSRAGDLLRVPRRDIRGEQGLGGGERR